MGLVFRELSEMPSPYPGMPSHGASLRNWEVDTCSISQEIDKLVNFSILDKLNVFYILNLSILDKLIGVVILNLSEMVRLLISQFIQNVEISQFHNLG